MERTIHNPWTWQEQFGVEQGTEVCGEVRTLYCAGQTPVDSDGAPQHEGDMAKQLILALDNVEAVLRSGDLTLADVVRLNIYVTDIDLFFEHYGVMAERLATAGCRYTGSLLEVSRLAMPGVLVEFEATAVA